MSFSITSTGDPRVSDLAKVRHLIGDEEKNDPILTDEMVEFHLELWPNNVFKASASAARAIAAKFSRQANERAGRLSVNFSDKSKQYMALAKDLDGRSGRFGLPSSGGINMDAKRSAELETDRVQPDFKKKMHDNPNTGLLDRDRFNG